MPKEVLNQVRALMREGYSESRAYAIAVENYKRRHGHAPRMHHKIAKAAEASVPPYSGSTQTDNRNRSFVITPEIIMQEQLVELRRIRELLDQIAKKQ